MKIIRRHSSLEVLNNILESFGDMDEIKTRLEDLADVLQEDKVLMDDMKEKYKQLELENVDLMKNIEKMKISVEAEEKEKEADCLLDELKKSLGKERRTSKSFSLQELRCGKDMDYNSFMNNNCINSIMNNSVNSMNSMNSINNMNGLTCINSINGNINNHINSSINSMNSMNSINNINNINNINGLTGINNNNGNSNNHINMELKKDPWDIKLPHAIQARLNQIAFDKRSFNKGTKSFTMTKVDSMTSIDKIREEIRKERAKCRSIVEDSVTTIEKIKAKLELERLKNRRIIERKITRIAELERKADDAVNLAQELKFENERNKEEVRRCKEELTLFKTQKHVNKEDYLKYKKFYLDRFVAYNWIILDLTNLEKLLPQKRLCFPRYKIERNIIRRVKKLVSDGMAIS